MLKDHETRIRKLEDSDIKQQIQLANIEKGNAEIKLMINDITREQRITLNDFTSKMLNTFTQNIKEDNKTKNKVKFYNTKQFWIALGTVLSILSSIITYFVTK